MQAGKSERAKARQPLATYHPHRQRRPHPEGLSRGKSTATFVTAVELAVDPPLARACSCGSIEPVFLQRERRERGSTRGRESKERQRHQQLRKNEDRAQEVDEIAVGRVYVEPARLSTRALAGVGDRFSNKPTQASQRVLLTALAENSSAVKGRQRDPGDKAAVFPFCEPVSRCPRGDIDSARRQGGL